MCDLPEQKKRNCKIMHYVEDCLLFCSHKNFDIALKFAKKP